MRLISIGFQRRAAGSSFIPKQSQGSGLRMCLPGGEPVAAPGISLPDVNLAENGAELLGGLVAQAARNVSKKLGRG